MLLLLYPILYPVCIPYILYDCICYYLSQGYYSDFISCPTNVPYVYREPSPVCYIRLSFVSRFLESRTVPPSLFVFLDVDFWFFVHIVLFLRGDLVCHPGWSAVVRFQLTVASTSWIQAILLPQSPE